MLPTQESILCAYWVYSHQSQSTLIWGSGTCVKRNARTKNAEWTSGFSTCPKPHMLVRLERTSQVIHMTILHTAEFYSTVELECTYMAQYEVDMTHTASVDMIWTPLGFLGEATVISECLTCRIRAIMFFIFVFTSWLNTNLQLCVATTQGCQRSKWICYRCNEERPLHIWQKIWPYLRMNYLKLH